MEWNPDKWTYNRYIGYIKHNLKFNIVEKPFDSRNDYCIQIIQNKLRRRNLPHLARANLGVKLKHFFQEKRIENLKIAGKLYGENHLKNLELGQNSAKALDEREIKKIDTQEEIAKLLGVSHDTISKIKKILEIASSKDNGFWNYCIGVFNPSEYRRLDTICIYHRLCQRHYLYDWHSHKYGYGQGVR